MNTKQHKSIFPDLLPHAITSKYTHTFIPMQILIPSVSNSSVRPRRRELHMAHVSQLFPGES